jgi:hypothetical protein
MTNVATFKVGRVLDDNSRGSPSNNYGLSAMEISVSGGTNEANPQTPGGGTPNGANTGSVTWAAAFSGAPWGKTGADDPGWKGTAASYGAMSAGKLPILWFESGSSGTLVVSTSSTTATSSTTGGNSAADDRLKLALQSVGVKTNSNIAPAMDATFNLMDGTNVKLSAYRGKPLIIGFGDITSQRYWSDFTKLSALWSAHKDDLQVVCSVGTHAANSKAIISSWNWVMPFFTNYNTPLNAYDGPSSFEPPLYLIIDSKGNCILQYKGLIDWGGVKTYLDKQ